MVIQHKKPPTFAWNHFIIEWKFNTGCFSHSLQVKYLFITDSSICFVLGFLLGFFFGNIFTRRLFAASSPLAT